MAELEKVIRGLECQYEPRMTCYGCGYFIARDKLCNKNKIFREAVDLLKAQEPRVMQFTEAMDAEVAWLEKYGENEIKPVIIMSYEYGYWECLIYDEDDAEILLTIDGFNTDWRCWTSRPSDSERGNTPWE